MSDFFALAMKHRGGMPPTGTGVYIEYIRFECGVEQASAKKSAVNRYQNHVAFGRGHHWRVPCLRLPFLTGQNVSSTKLFQ